MSHLPLSPFNIYMRYARKERPATCMFKKFLKAVVESLYNDLNLEIRHVPDVPSEREVPCMLCDKIAIENSLHFPRNHASNFFHVRAEGFEPPTLSV